MDHCSLPTPSSLMAPAHLDDPNPWIGHIPFAFWLIEQAKPQGQLVELGTHSGNSYFAFCQSVLANALPTRCNAVDTWEGDLHSSPYGEEVYQSVSTYNTRQYKDFSRLLRMRFDEALTQFPNGSVDLLHIDGFHTYEAARHDFESWTPKLSRSSIVLLHDTMIREKDFGIWRLWNELSPYFPNIHFEHSNGLGVLFMGEAQHPVIARALKALDIPADRDLFIRFFETVGRVIELEWQNAKLEKKLAYRESHIDSVRRSFSWRVTGPIRIVARSLDRFRANSGPLKKG